MLFADLALARRLEKAEALNGIECARAQTGPGAAVEELAGGYAIFVGVNSLLTHALGLGMDGPVPASQIDKMEDFYRSRGAPVNVDLCPYAHPTLVELLGRRGYRIFEFNNVLVRPVGGEAPEMEDPRANETAPEEAGIWARTLAEGFFERTELSRDELEVGATLFRSRGTRCFLARTAQGEAAAAAAMAVREGIATFFSDSTPPRFRRAGLHTALIRARLNRARAEGCGLATAATLPGSISQRNYEKLGFRVVYTRVGVTA